MKKEYIYIYKYILFYPIFRKAMHFFISVLEFIRESIHKVGVFKKYKKFQLKGIGKRYFYPW